MRFDKIFLLFLVSLLSLSAVHGYAESKATSICDVLLASAPADPKTAGYHPYARLVEYYMRNIDTDSSDAAMEEILASKQVINPLEGLKDSASQQVSAGFEQLRKQLSADDWARIQNEVRLLVNQKKQEAKDKDQKEEDASVVFSPKQLDILDLERQNYKNQSWQIVNDRTFVALTTNQGLGVVHFVVYEVVNKKLVEFFRDKIDYLSATAPAWKVTDNKVQILVSTTANSIFTFELIDNRFIKVDHFTKPFESESATIQFSSAALVGNSLFIDAHDHTGAFYLYEFKDGVLKKLANDSIGKPINSQFLQFIDGRIFISFIGDHRTLFVFEYTNGKLLKLAEHDSLNYEFYDSPALQIINGDILASVGNSGGQIYLYEIKNEKVHELDVFKAEKGLISTPVWLSFEDREIVAANGSSKKNYFFEIINKKLMLLGTFETNSGDNNTPALKIKDGEAYLTVASKYNNKFYLYKIFSKLKRKK